jgi:hypothetical protein
MDAINVRVFDHPADSYSRELDWNVARQEMPYGYDEAPPPADTGDYNQARIETKKDINRGYK